MVETRIPQGLYERVHRTARAWRVSLTTPLRIAMAWAWRHRKTSARLRQALTMHLRWYREYQSHRRIRMRMVKLPRRMLDRLERFGRRYYGGGDVARWRGVKGYVLAAVWDAFEREFPVLVPERKEKG